MMREKGEVGTRGPTYKYKKPENKGQVGDERKGRGGGGWDTGA